jgi:hypothetical protein
MLYDLICEVDAIAVGFDQSCLDPFAHARTEDPSLAGSMKIANQQ